MRLAEPARTERRPTVGAENAGAAVGIVSSIVGMRQLRLEFSGAFCIGAGAPVRCVGYIFTDLLLVCRLGRFWTSHMPIGNSLGMASRPGLQFDCYSYVLCHHSSSSCKVWAQKLKSSKVSKV